MEGATEYINNFLKEVTVETGSSSSDQIMMSITINDGINFPIVKQGNLTDFLTFIKINDKV